MIVADTSVWIDYVKGIDASHTNILDHELIYNRVVTGDIIIAEFLQGFKNDREYLIAKLAPNAKIGEGLSVHYSGGSSLGKDVTKWLNKSGVAVK